jgi:hypothetical protein
VDNEKNIIADVENYIRQGGGEYREWYIGLADNPIDPIIEAYRFRKVQSHRFTYIETISHDVAQAVADYFVNVCGTDGNLSKTIQANPCRSVYLYKKAEQLHSCETPIEV